MSFQSNQDYDGELKVFKTPARLEGKVSLDFRKELKEIVDKGYYKIVIDLGETDFIDSNGISSLVSKISATRSEQGDIRLANPSDFVVSVLRTTNLDKIFKCYPSAEEAVNSYSEQHETS